MCLRVVPLLYGLVLVQVLVQVQGALDEYLLVNLKLNWTEARQFCRLLSRDLASVETDQDLAGIQLPAGTSAWIGLFDDPASWRGVMASDPNSWRWSSTGTSSPGGFQSWDSGEPNNSGGKELCVFIQNGLWRDFRCEVQLHFFCQTARPDSVEYFLVTTALAWADAQAHCRQQYQDLATIRSPSQNQAVSRLLPSATASVWIGLGRRAWAWADRSPSPFRRWLSLEPNNLYGVEQCCAYRRDGYWNDAPCSAQAPFICRAVPRGGLLVKIFVQASVDFISRAMNEHLLKLLESRLNVNAVGFMLSWKILPTKEMKPQKQEVCPL